MERRSFVKTGAVLGAASVLPKFSFAQVKGNDRIKVGLIGCGGRGTGAAINMASADANIKIVAIADLFEDKLPSAVDKISKGISKKYAQESKNIFDPDTVKKFAGWDAIDQLLREDVDVVIEATPPVFRTPHFAKIVAAGKHAFLEKPACVDATQARQMLALSKEATAKGLSVVCGTQRRYHEGYQEMVKRVQDGEIGDIVSGQCYWNSTGYVGFAQHNHGELAYDTMEYQIRNWFSFIWASGDHIVEQHVHNLDVLMWILGDNRKPVDVRGWGGRSTDLETPKYGDRFSHFAVDFDMGNGLRIASYCQQDPGGSQEIGERVVGTKGVMYSNLYGTISFVDSKGNKFWQAAGKYSEAMEAEHKFLLDSVRNGRRVNKLDQLINSTMLAIAGRISAYSGAKFKYDWVLAKSKENFLPEKLEFGKFPLGTVPVPGKNKMV